MIRLLCVCLAALLLVSCTTFSPSQPPSAAGLYGPEPVKQEIPGSNAQAIVSRTVNYTHEEVLEAARTAMMRIGYNVQETDPGKGKIAGSKFNCTATAAIYVRQINPEPTSTFTIVLDVYDWMCSANDGEIGIADNLATEIQKVLSTY